MEMKHLLTDALREIERLRNVNEILGAQVRVIDVFAMALRAPTPGGGLMGVDVAWSIREQLAKIEAADKKDCGERERPGVRGSMAA